MMTTVEQHELAEQEAIIERNMAAFVEVGLALLAIRERKLYLATHSTFKEYCQERWGMGDSYARKTIQGAKTVKEIQASGTIVPLPQNEYQARSLIASTSSVPELPVIPVNRNVIRCQAIMDELTANPDLARLVRIELMKWYALNG